jgi:hypothetical protein
MQDVPVYGKVWKVNLMYYVHHSPLVGVCVFYVRILAQLLSIPKLTQRTMSDTAKNVFTS